MNVTPDLLAELRRLSQLLVMAMAEEATNPAVVLALLDEIERLRRGNP